MVSTKSSIGFGVIGAGRIGNLHARHIAGAVDGAHLVTVMDADLSAAQKAAFGGAKVTQDVLEEKWHSLSDSAIASFLLTEPEKRKSRLAMTVEDAFEEGLQKLEATTCCYSDQLVDKQLKEFKGPHF